MARKPNGQLTKDYREILNLQYQFYEDLYSRDHAVKFRLTNESGVYLNPTQQRVSNEPFSEEELFDAMMTLKKGKTPGWDRIGLALYKKFWKELKWPLYLMLSDAVRSGRLNCTGHRGIITLIPKKNKDDLLVKNWHPITLLNYDYKIYAKMIANRLEIFADEMIGKQQTGFVKGRCITSNIRRTAEIVAYLERKNKPGVIAMVDFEKCFDRIDHNSIRAVFKYFKFGDIFIDMLMILYKDFKLCTSNNGYLSPILKKNRGINQGCPGSPLVYTYCGEILNHLIKQNTSIKGIPMPFLSNILSQFADDTGAFLKFECITIEEFGRTLQTIEAQMGLKVSYDKTTLYRVGLIRNSNAKLYTAQNFKWSNDSIDTLGVKLSCDKNLDVSNFLDIVNKVENICSQWKNRTLTLSGKVLLINSLMGSLYIYKMLSLQNVANTEIDKFYKTVKLFLWGNKRAIVRLETLMKKKHQGGLGLVN